MTDVHEFVAKFTGARAAFDSLEAVLNSAYALACEARGRYQRAGQTAMSTLAGNAVDVVNGVFGVGRPYLDEFSSLSDVMTDLPQEGNDERIISVIDVVFEVIGTSTPDIVGPLTASAAEVRADLGVTSPRLVTALEKTAETAGSATKAADALRETSTAYRKTLMADSA